MKERSNYTKKKLLESGRAPRTVFDQEEKQEWQNQIFIT